MKSEKETLREVTIEILTTMKRFYGDSNVDFEPFIEITRKCNRLNEIKMLLNDITEWGKHMKPEEMAQLDESLKNKRLPSFTQITNNKYKKLLAVISRGHIKNESEYYLVNDFACDVTEGLITENERQSINKLIGEYEEKLEHPT
jgi:hypothetical protein